MPSFWCVCFCALGVRCFDAQVGLTVHFDSIFVDQYHITIFSENILKIVSSNLPTQYSKLAMTMSYFLSGIFKLHHSCYYIYKSDITFLITFQVNFPVSSTIFNSLHCLNYVLLVILSYCCRWKDSFLNFVFLLYLYIHLLMSFERSTPKTKLHCTALKVSLNFVFICKNCQLKSNIFKIPNNSWSSLIFNKG